MLAALRSLRRQLTGEMTGGKVGGLSRTADLTKLRKAGYDAPFLSLEEGVKLL